MTLKIRENTNGYCLRSFSVAVHFVSVTFLENETSTVHRPPSSLELICTPYNLSHVISKHDFDMLKPSILGQGDL